MNEQHVSPATSPSLLLRVRNSDDAESWETFERIYGSIVRSYCHCWKLQPFDVDDVVQEVMSAVARGIRTFDYDPAKGRFRAWLGTVTANKIKRFLERKSRNREEVLPFENETVEKTKAYADPDASWVEIFSERILIAACRRIRPDFESKSWHCFSATWIDRESPEAVANELGIAIHSVYVNKSRVMKRLEKEIRLLAEDVAFDFH